ncbi:hypothetical protein [Vibrio cholerae]|uniref:hypothetical protein n=1 Tax=Vibrio cholerae TaxID=666 RepID=UPI0011DA5610|nr:hypothetical protein [Vibrio cholerae]TXY52075.1 hypothetical protein FXE74_19020 [Vibrio cholerae]GIB31770.1 hypothetical protein VCSRO91_2822 [Vibrio cholerae]
MSDVSKMAAVAYERDSLKPEIVSFNNMVSVSRKFGFPITCIINKTENEQLLWAAKLLLEISQSYPLCDLPDDFNLQQGTKLYDDSKRLLENALSNTNRIVKNAPKF